MLSTPNHLADSTSSPANARPSVFSLLPRELADLLTAHGLPKFRAPQLLDWVYRKGISDPSAMTTFSKSDQAKISGLLDFSSGRLVTRQDSADGTMKLLLDWPDDAAPLSPRQAETVMIPDADSRESRSGRPRRTACVSSQVGCPVGCKFCASGMNGVKGSLSAGQIVGQIVSLNRLLAPDGITNVVFMGMGEPMANYAAVIKAVRILTDPQCVGLGQRRITISTVGVPDRIRKLAEEDLSVTLALSLHAPNEPLRRELIPWAEHFALPDILNACRYYFTQTGREVTLEYILLHGVNDRPAHAKELAALCRTMRVNVNLIRYNEVAGLPFLRPDGDDVVAFQNILRKAGVNVHVRRSRGRDIDAACGQLRRKQQQQQVVTLGGAS